jgi:hypothetical protein
MVATREPSGLIPTQATAILFRRLPPRLVNHLIALTSRLTTPDLTRHGLPRPTQGVYTRLLADGHIPIVDVGLIDLITAGKVEIVPAVSGFDGSKVLLVDAAPIPQTSSSRPPVTPATSNNSWATSASSTTAASQQSTQTKLTPPPRTFISPASPPRSAACCANSTSTPDRQSTRNAMTARVAGGNAVVPRSHRPDRGSQQRDWPFRSSQTAASRIGSVSMR